MPETGLDKKGGKLKGNAAAGRQKADSRFSRALLLCVLYVVAVVIIVMSAGRPFGYPLDDTYIHMAIGRTVATSGVWGVGAATPAAASSSPLWTLLLAAAYVAHPGEAFFYVPLLLNMIAACGLIMLLLTMFGPQPASLALTAAIACAACLPGLSILGMEHLLHALLAAALCFVACRSIAKPYEDKSVADLALIAALAGLAVAARYESLFLVAPLIVLSAARWRWRTAMAIGVGAALPVVGFGLLWMHNGGWFLPNSLIIKTRLAEDTGLFAWLLNAIEDLSHNLRISALRGGFAAMLLGLSGLLVWRLFRCRQVWDMPVLFAVCALLATGGHFAFAAVGWLYRYEAWLIVLDATAICLLAQSLLGHKQLLAVAAALVVIFSYRTAMATIATIQSIDDRRLEHLPPAHFVAANYPGKTVLVNDIGAMAWFAPQTRFLDMFGLGNNEPVRFRRAPGGYDSAVLRDWAVQNNARIAVVQICWEEVKPRLPVEWTLVATWLIPRNVAFGDRLVGFFAIAAGEQDDLRKHLEQFPVPAGVTLNLEPPQAALLDCK